MRTWVRCCVLVVSLGFVVGLVGCGGPPPPPVAIQLNVQATSGQLNYLQPNVLTATVSNAKDSTVEWKLTCEAGQGTQCGTLTYANGGGLLNGTNADESLSGVQVNYLPPGAGVYTITFTATSVADPTKTSAVTITRGYPLMVTMQTIPASMTVGTQSLLSAYASGDPLFAMSIAREGLSWTLSCGSADCGTFGADPANIQLSSDSRTAWGIGTRVTYNAPATVPSGGTVTIKVFYYAESVPDPSHPSATSTITITPQ